MTASSDMSLATVGKQIYNRWLADFCSVEPERHAGMVQLPVWDIESSVAEVRLGAERGLREVNFPAPRPELPAFNSPHWEPLWSVYEDCSMPLNTHSGAGAAVAGVGAGDGPGASHIRHFEDVRFSARGLWWLILGGVFGRHKRLKFILTENPGLMPLRSCLSDIDGDAAARMAGSNLIDLFALDRSKLQAVADRIGPSAEKLGTAVRTEKIPSGADRAEFSMAFRRAMTCGCSSLRPDRLAQGAVGGEDQCRDI